MQHCLLVDRMVSTSIWPDPCIPRHYLADLSLLEATPINESVCVYETRLRNY